MKTRAATLHQMSVFNNAGVTLLEKGYAAQAAHIFHQPLHGTSNHGAASCDWSRVAVSAPFNDIFVMEAHAVDNHDVDGQTDALLYGPSSSFVVLIRLTTPTDTAYTRAACAYNATMAYRCLYAETDNAALLMGAERILRSLGVHHDKVDDRLLASLIQCALERVQKEQQRHTLYDCDCAWE